MATESAPPSSPQPRQFFTLIEVEVLHEGELHFDDVADLHHHITDGDCSGTFRVVYCRGQQRSWFAEQVVAQGSDPEFFQLDADGNDLDDADAVA